MHARSFTAALTGLDGALIEIQAHIDPGLTGFVLNGLPDTEVGDAKDRIRSAAAAAGVPLTRRRLTVDLAPAAFAKYGRHYDLGIAVAAAAADGIVNRESVDGVAHIGALGHDGRLHPVDGVLPMTLIAFRARFDTVMVADANAAEARLLLPGVRVVSVASLRDALIWHGAALEPVPTEPVAAPEPQHVTLPAGELADIADSRVAEALQVAAAGAHHMYLIDADKTATQVVHRLPALLPDLTATEAYEVTAIRSLARLGVDRLATRPPFEAPHHSASAAAMVGGGSGIIRPGAAARAAHGVLFLEDAAEFSPATLDALRQPLEVGAITVARANLTARYPARFQLVLATKPCPCGRGGTPECTCTPFAVRRYLSRLSGPLLDRVSIRLRLDDARHDGPRVTTAHARAAVERARAAARERLRTTPWRTNAQVPGSFLHSPDGAPHAGSTTRLDRALERGMITMRGYDHVLRVAWTYADFDGHDRPTADDVDRALTLRLGR